MSPKNLRLLLSTVAMNTTWCYMPYFFSCSFSTTGSFHSDVRVVRNSARDELLRVAELLGSQQRLNAFLYYG